jgi:hypothetical protein
MFRKLYTLSPSYRKWMSLPEGLHDATDPTDWDYCTRRDRWFLEAVAGLVHLTQHLHQGLYHALGHPRWAKPADYCNCRDYTDHAKWSVKLMWSWEPQFFLWMVRKTKLTGRRVWCIWMGWLFVLIVKAWDY